MVCYEVNGVSGHQDSEFTATECTSSAVVCKGFGKCFIFLDVMALACEGKVVGKRFFHARLWQQRGCTGAFDYLCHSQCYLVIGDGDVV